MKKLTRAFASIICFVMLLSLCACTPSPTAVTVNGAKIDSAELAFYMEYNRINLENKYGYISDGNYDEKITETVKTDALAQIVSAEIIRQKCQEFKLKLSKETKDSLAADKKYLIEGQGGKAQYLKFLNENAMTDRMYDKFQENSKYYDLLFAHLVGNGGQFQYTDENLRKFFGENYAKLQYIRFSFVGADGNQITEAEQDAQMKKAQETLAQVRSIGSDFTQILRDYNDDAFMNASPEGVVLSTLEISNLVQYKDLFSMKNGEVAGVNVGPDGYYIIKRIALDAGYFDKNRDAIVRAAEEWKYSELMAKWEKEATVKTTAQFKSMNLKNHLSHVK